MTISTSSNLISIFDLNREFGSNFNLATCGPLSLSQFYRNSKYVPVNPAVAGGVDGQLSSQIPIEPVYPATALISLNSFREAHGKLWNSFYGPPDEGNYAMAPDTISQGVYTVSQYSIQGVLRKWDSMGNVVWSVGLSTTPTETYTRLWSVSVDNLGNVYVVGNNTQHGGAVLVAKYDTLGALQWQKIYRAPTDWFFGRIDVKVFGSITQYIYLSFTVAANTSPVQSKGIYLLKLATSDGAISWNRRLDAGNPGENTLAAVTVTNEYSYNIYAVGNCIIGTAAPTDGLIVKYDSSGVLQWQKAVRTPNPADVVYLTGVAVDSSNNVYAIGLSGRLDGLSALYTLCLFKLDPSGTLLWQRKLGGTGNNDYVSGISIAIDSNDNIFITGRYHDNLSWPRSVAIYAKYSTSGVLQWQRYFGGYVPPYASTLTSGGDANANPTNNGIAIDTNDSVYIHYSQGFISNLQSGLTKLPTVTTNQVTPITAGAIFQVQNKGILYGQLTSVEAAGTATVTNATLSDISSAATSSSTSLVSSIGSGRLQTHPLSTTYFGIILGTPLPTYQISGPKMQVIELEYYTYGGNIGPLSTSPIFDTSFPKNNQVYTVSTGDKALGGFDVYQLQLNNSGVVSTSDYYGGFTGAPYLQARGCAVSTNSNFVTYMAQGSVADGGGANTLLLTRRTTDSNTVWSQTEIYSSVGDNITGQSVAVDNWAYGGNAIVAMYYTDSANSAVVAAIISINNSGAPNWQRKLYNSSSNVAGTGSTVDTSAAYSSTNPVYLAGNYSQPKFPSTPTQFGLFLAKYDYFGVIQWQKVLFANNYCYGGVPYYDKSSGCVYLPGKSLDSGNSGAVLAKYNSAGTLQWQRVVKGTGYGFHYVVTDWNGNVYALGNFGSSTEYIHLVKYSSSGVIQWRKNIYGSRSGSYWVAGLTMDYMGIIWISGNNSNRPFIIKIDPTTSHNDYSRFRTLDSEFAIETGSSLSDVASTLIDGTGSFTDAAGNQSVLTAGTGYSGYTSYNSVTQPLITTSMIYAYEPTISAFSAYITTNQTNLNLRTWALANGWDGTGAATIRINTGVYVYSTLSYSAAGLTIDGSWPNGVTLINDGIIMGYGGSGAPGDSFSGTPAIKLGTACIVANNGHILGGGGAGVSYAVYVSASYGTCTNGGGGGAGGGQGRASSWSGGSGGLTAAGDGGAGGLPGLPGATPTIAIPGAPGVGGGGGEAGGGGGSGPASDGTYFYAGAGGGGGRSVTSMNGGSGSIVGGSYGGPGGSFGGVGGAGGGGTGNGAGGGGGYGAAGGGAGGLGGRSIWLNGYVVTLTNNGTMYGAVS